MGKKREMMVRNGGLGGMQMIKGKEERMSKGKRYLESLSYIDLMKNTILLVMSRMITETSLILFKLPK